MFSDDALLDAEFDPVAFLKHTLHLPNVEAEHAKLQRCTDMIDSDIRSAVADNYDEMLQQVDATTKVVKETERLRSNVTTLSSALVRLHHTIEAPFEAIQTSGTELRNATNALDTLRAVQKLLAAVSKLPETNAKDMDIHRAARKLKDIDELLAVENLSGIHVVDKALAEVTALSAAVRSRAQEMLRGGLVAGKQTDISTALHALTTLGVATRVVSNYLAEAKRETLKALMVLDPQPIAAEMAEQSDINKGKELIFTHLERVLSEVSSRCSLVLVLMRTVQKQNAPTSTSELTNSSSSANDDSSAAFTDYSVAISSHLVERLTKLGKKGVVNGVLATEYPRYFRIILKFAEGLEPLLVAGGAASTQTWVAKAVEDVEKLFESHVAEKQRDKLQQIITKLNGLFPRQGTDSTVVDLSVDVARPTVPPQANMIDTRPLIKVIGADLAVGRQDAKLSAFYINTTTNTLAQLLERLNEGHTRVPLTFSPSAQLTVGQLFHISLCNLATSVHSEVSSIVSLTGGAAASQATEATLKLRTILDGFQTFAVRITSTFLTQSSPTIWAAIKAYLSDGDSNALDTKLRTVLGRQLLFFIRSTPQYENNRLDAANTLVLRAVAFYCAQRAGEVDKERLRAIPTTLTPLGNFERMPSSTRSHFRTITATSSNKSPLPSTLHPILQIAILFAQVPEGTGVLLHTAMKISSDQFTVVAASLINGTATKEVKENTSRQVADAIQNTSKSFMPATQQQLEGLLARLREA